MSPITRCLIILVLAFATIDSAAAMLRLPMEMGVVPNGESSLRRYISDPMAPTQTIYSSLVNIGGQNYRLVLDTGSQITYIVSRGCKIAPSLGATPSSVGCRYASNFYSESGTLLDWSLTKCNGASFTYQGQAGKCRLFSTYGDGSFVDSVARQETITVGPYSGTTEFGAAFATSNKFSLAGSDGIWGLGRPLNFIVMPSGPLKTLFDAGMPQIFAMCFTATGGDFHLAGYDRTFASGAISWHTMDATSPHYQIEMTSMSVGTAVVDNSNVNVILDSGTTIAYLPPALFTAFTGAITAYCPSCDVQIFSGNIAFLDPATYPTITLSFADISGTVRDMVLQPNDYLRASVIEVLPPATYVTVYTGGIQPGLFTDRYGNYVALFGQTMMSLWYTVFDIGNGVIGLGQVVPSKCSNALPVIAPTAQVTLTPSTPKPPTSTGGLVPHADAPSPRGPISTTPIPTPITTPITTPISTPIFPIPITVTPPTPPTIVTNPTIPTQHTTPIVNPTTAPSNASDTRMCILLTILVILCGLLA